MRSSVRAAIFSLAVVIGFTLVAANVAHAQTNRADQDRPQGQNRDDGKHGDQGTYRDWPGERNNTATENGRQDGMNDGMHDRQTGHSFRPTQDSNYKHADRGYTSSFGDKNEFKQVYRQAYEQAYRQGYYAQGDHDRDRDRNYDSGHDHY